MLDATRDGVVRNALVLPVGNERNALVWPRDWLQWIRIAAWRSGKHWHERMERKWSGRRSHAVGARRSEPLHDSSVVSSEEACSSFRSLEEEATVLSLAVLMSTEPPLLFRRFPIVLLPSGSGSPVRTNDNTT